jgi:hypothetical protein
MLEVHQDAERVPDDRMRTMSLGLYDEANTASVVLVAGVVEAAGGGLESVWHKLL